MRRVLHRVRRAVAVLPAVAMLLSLAACDPGGRPPPGATGESELRIAVPAYVNPPDAAYWKALIDAAPTVRDVIVNPNSGPGTTLSQPYVQLIKTLRDAGLEVLGYIPTEYGARDAAQVTAEIDRWREWYGVDDIFFDEVPAVAAGIPAYAGYAAAVHGRDGTVVLNPGLVPDRGYFDFADAIVTFESPFDAYKNAKEPPDWLRTQTNAEVWHIVSGVPRDRLTDVVDQARKHAVDHIYVTDDAEPNPYDRLPSYWGAQLDAVRG